MVWASNCPRNSFCDGSSVKVQGNCLSILSCQLYHAIFKATLECAGSQIGASKWSHCLQAVYCHILSLPHQFSSAIVWLACRHWASLSCCHSWWHRVMWLLRYWSTGNQVPSRTGIPFSLTLRTDNSVWRNNLQENWSWRYPTTTMYKCRHSSQCVAKSTVTSYVGRQPEFMWSAFKPTQS